MKKHINTSIFIIVGLINFAPITGVLGAERLIVGYGLTTLNQDLTLLLQHRAVLFGIIGGYLLFSAFRPSHRPVATVMGFASMVSFLLLFGFSDSRNENLSLIMTIDLIAIGLLLIAAVMECRLQTKTQS